MPVIGATELQPMNFLEQYAKGLEVGAGERALQRQEVERIKALDAQRAAAEQQAVLNQIYASATTPTGEVDVNRLTQMLASRGFGSAIPTMQAQQADIAFKTGQAAKQRADAQTAAFTRMRDMLGAVNDQAGYDVWRNSALQTYGNIPGIENLLPQQFTPETKDRLILTANDIVSRMPMSAEKFAQEKELRQAGRSSQVVNLPPAESERARTLGKAGGEALVSEFNAATAASKGLAKDYEALSVLRSGKPATGITSELQTGVDRLRSAVAGDPAAAERVSDSQYLEALLGSDVFAQMQSLGVGARGLDTPAEREFLREVISGTRKLDKDTLIRMAEMRAKYKEQAVDSWNERVRSGELDDFYRDFGRPKRELSKPTRPKAAEPPSGAPKTFANEAEAEAAFKAGKIKRGDRVTIGGVSGRWE